MVIVIGLGLGLYFFGGWATNRGEGAGWVAYAPLSNGINAAALPGSGLHPWVRLIIWLVLIIIWVAAAIALLRSPPASKVREHEQIGTQPEPE